MVLLVGIEQLTGDVRERCSSAGIQVQQPRLQVGRFQGHDLPQAPEDGTGQFPGVLAFDYLRSTGDEPHTLVRGQVRIDQRLDKRQRARSRLSYVAFKLTGGGLGTVTFYTLEVDDTVEGQVLRQAFEQ